MEPISVFDMLKVGIGPSSSHTLGPWRAARQFIRRLRDRKLLVQTHRIKVSLYGSLALTGKGHGTDIAVVLGLCDADPVTIPLSEVHDLPERVSHDHSLQPEAGLQICFDPATDIVFHFSERLPFHANGMRFEARNVQGATLHLDTYYSIGGGFIVREGEENRTEAVRLPHSVQQGADLLQHCREQACSIADIVWANERAWRSPGETESGLLQIWRVMRESIYRGCHREGTLPGGLKVSRRAPAINRKLLADADYSNVEEWMHRIRYGRYGFSDILKWIGCFAMAVNEENASFGRIVTAPTNGAAGVIPAVLLYLHCFTDREVTPREIVRFLLVAGQVGSLFKQGATISAAMGGCQAEIGVSSAMAAGALTESLGGKPEQALMAAEIAMEHHLGLTCDPVGGLVQVPCIERNSMGAIKAITAAKIAMESDPSRACVSLDQVIRTMWDTAQDMNSKYKETSQGGLAVNISIKVPEC